MKKDGPVVKIVTYDVPSQSLETFLNLCRINAEASRKEPGVTGFRIVRPDGEPNKVVLVETYVSQAASDDHRLTPHFLAFVKAVEPTGAKRSAMSGSEYAPQATFH